MKLKSKKFILPLIIACFSVVILTSGILMFTEDKKYRSEAATSTWYFDMKGYWSNNPSAGSSTTFSSIGPYKSQDGNTYSGNIGEFSVTVTKDSGAGSPSVKNETGYGPTGDGYYYGYARLDSGYLVGSDTYTFNASFRIKAYDGFYVNYFYKSDYGGGGLGNVDSYTPSEGFDSIFSTSLSWGRIITLSASFWSGSENSSAAYILFRPRTYTITFNANGGSSNSSKSIAFYNDYELPSSNPTRTGYDFVGWYNTSAQTGGSRIYSSTTMSKSSNHSVYARWDAHTYKVVFNKNANNATGSMSNQSFTYGTSQNLTANGFTRYGYNFAGWATSPAGGVVYDDKESVKNLTSVDDGTVNLYAVWTPKTNCVLYFNANLPSGATASINPTQKNVTFNSTYGTLATGTRTGYTLDGWYTTSACTTKVSTSTKVTSESQTVYAKWKPNTYYVKFNGNGNTGGSMTNQTFTYDTGQNLKANAFEKTGYSFQGWATSASGNKVYDDKASVKNLTSSNGGTVNLYAVWKANDYTLKYNANGGTVSPTTKSVTFNTEYGTLPIPTRAGYIFIGWYTSDNGGTQVSSTTKMTTEGAEIFAHWQDTWASYVTGEDEPNLKVPGNPNTKDNPYLITSAKNLAWLAMQAQTKNLGGYYEQTANIDLSQHYWLPIGTNTYYFNGQYDGQGYLITGLKTAPVTNVSNSTSVNSYVGLFGHTDRTATLLNIYVKDAVITGHTYVGGIVGYASGSTIMTSCAFSGDITATANSGALIGYSSENTVQIKDSVVFSTNQTALNTGYANITSTVYILNGKKGYVGDNFDNWVFVSGMQTPVPKGISWLAEGGEQATLADIQNWANS